jgi:hypothetical protein
VLSVVHHLRSSQIVGAGVTIGSIGTGVGEGVGDTDGELVLQTSMYSQVATFPKTERQHSFKFL